MIQKELDKIEEKDLQDLVDNVVLEGKTIEYKRELPGNADADKKEFLADVSSFANAGGGDLIFGMAEAPQTKEPKSLDGLDLPSTVDQEKTRLDNIIREGLEPRLPTVHIRPVPLSSGKTALVIRVGKSWVSPHRVIYKGHDKFYSRNSSGKYPLDVGELRTAFTMSETITERIRRFREERIARLYANETPVPFVDNPKTVLHLVPVGAFAASNRCDIDKVWLDGIPLTPIYSSSTTGRHTLEGYLRYSPIEGEKVTSYAHLYRNGIIEAVEGMMLVDRGSLIPGIAFEDEIIKALRTYLRALSRIEVEPPFIVFLTLVAVRGYTMDVRTSRWADNDTYPIDRDVLDLPEFVVDRSDPDAAETLKPAFDAMWNACGQPKSRGYDEKGRRVGRV